MVGTAGAALFVIIGTQGQWHRLRRVAATLLLVGSFLWPLRIPVEIALEGKPGRSLVLARAIAAAIRATGAPGGIASVDNAAASAVFTAFLLDRPFLGNEGALSEDIIPDVTRLRDMEVGFLLVRLDWPAEAALAADRRVARLPLDVPRIAVYRLL